MSGESQILLGVLSLMVIVGVAVLKYVFVKISETYSWIREADRRQGELCSILVKVEKQLESLQKNYDHNIPDVWRTLDSVRKESVRIAEDLGRVKAICEGKE